VAVSTASTRIVQIPDASPIRAITDDVTVSVRARTFARIRVEKPQRAFGQCATLDSLRCMARIGMRADAVRAARNHC
jgi:hypothetical protein